ncbi:hypothetical protein KBI23_08330 [bacterium]|nr:hypothetical protein [bacterium]
MANDKQITEIGQEPLEGAARPALVSEQYDQSSQAVREQCFRQSGNPSLPDCQIVTDAEKASSDSPSSLSKAGNIAALAGEGAVDYVAEHPWRVAGEAAVAVAAGAALAVTAPAWVTVGAVGLGVGLVGKEIYDSAQTLLPAIDTLCSDSSGDDPANYKKAEETVKTQLGEAVAEGLVGTIGGAAGKPVAKGGKLLFDKVLGEGAEEASEQGVKALGMQLGRPLDEVRGKFGSLERDLGIDLFDFASTRKAKYVTEMTANPRIQVSGERITDGNTRYLYAREKLGMTDEEIVVRTPDGNVSMAAYKRQLDQKALLKAADTGSVTN